jgi:hypothetical protein
MAEVKHTRDSIRSLLEGSDKAVVRGFRVIHSLQTRGEREWGVTVEHNGVGWSGRDAELMSELYEKLVKYGSFTPKQLVLVRRKVLKYAGQLAKVANGQITVEVV